MRSDNEIFASMSDERREQVKARLDELHLRKIDLAHEVLVLNVGGYIGQSTRRELKYAQEQGKVVRFLENCCPECGSDDIFGVTAGRDDRDVVMVCRVCDSHTVIA